jgi:hypothetical protein
LHNEAIQGGIVNSNSAQGNLDDAGNNRIVFRRLMLAKELFLHGLDHSKRPGALNKMIAVHNFHNAVEVVLRSILLKYDIRVEKQLNMTFEVMLSEIDNHPLFRERAIKLPHRQELRNLNQIRNWVQHHAIEPESTTLDDLRVLTRRALEIICESYFEINFQSLTPIEMVDDEDLRTLLGISFTATEKKQLRDALVIGTITYKYAENSILGSLAEPALTFVPSFDFPSYDDWGTHKDDPRWKELQRAMTAINTKLEEISNLSVLSSTGMNLADWNKFHEGTPNVVFTIGGRAHVNLADRELDQEEVRSILNFILNTIIGWQMLGLKPTVPTWGVESAKKLIQDNNALTSDTDSLIAHTDVVSGMLWKI